MSDTLPNKGQNEATLIIEGREIIFDTLSLRRSFDHGADGWTAVIPWQEGLDPELDKITMPYKYSNAAIYLGGQLQNESTLYDVSHNIDNRGRTKKLDGWSKIANIIDSTIYPPYEMNNVTLSERCKQQCEPYGIQVIVGPDAAEKINETRRKVVMTGYKWQTAKQNDKNYTGLQFGNKDIKYVPTYKSKLIKEEKKFPRVCAKPTEKIFDHLVALAKQRGVILSCTKHGDLLITTANINGESVGTITEDGSYIAEQYVASFIGRKRYATYKAIAQSAHSKNASKTGVATDLTVKSPRLLVFNASDDIPGNAKSAAEWRKNKTAAESLDIPFPVNTWYAPNGKLWEANSLVTIISPTLLVKNGFTFLITDVEFTSSREESSAILKIVPPTLYAAGEMVEPWS